MVGKVGDRKLQNTFEKDNTQHPPKELKVGEQDAYLSAGGSLTGAAAEAASSSSIGSRGPLSAPSRAGPSSAVSMRGRGRDQWGGARAPACRAGAQGRPGAQLPSLLAGIGDSPPGLQREGIGGLSQAGAGSVRAFHLFPVDCTKGFGASGTAPNSSGWNGRTPSILG